MLYSKYMNQPTPDISIETLTQYSDPDAADIGHLLAHLSNTFDGQPVGENTLRSIIESPYHDQLVARDKSGKIIGTLTISQTMGAGVVRKAWLEDFIVDPSLQGAGVGSKLWDALLDWCRDHDVHQLDFTSRPTKEAAQHFYLKRGAIIRDTNYFRKIID